MKVNDRLKQSIEEKQHTLSIAPIPQIQEILPPSISHTTSARLMVDVLCDTNTTVLRSQDSFRDFNIIPSFSESRLLVGSSRRRNGAS